MNQIFKAGDRVKVLKAQEGALGAVGKIGVLVDSDNACFNGLIYSATKFRDDATGIVWGLGGRSQVELEMILANRDSVTEVYAKGNEKTIPPRPLVGIGGAPTRATTLPTAAADRKKYPVASGFMDYFPDAVCAVANLSYVGNEQHNPGKPLHWDRSKSGDEGDTMLRHFLQRGTLDTDGVRHSVKMAWRALAMLQKEIENEGTKVGC